MSKRTFILGDEWLYYKIYCGSRMADMLLAQSIKPLTTQLLQSGSIDQWFFIRYHDPDTHIRIRFHLADITKIGAVIMLIRQYFQPYMDDDIIYKIQVDTYQRELERYGSNTIEVCEKLFYHESKMVVELLSLIEDEQLYFLFVIRAVNQLLNSFGYNQEEKLKLAKQNKNAYKKEFKADKTLNGQLDKKYRKLEKELALFLDPSYSNEEYLVLDQILDTKKNDTSGYIKEILHHNKSNTLTIGLDDLISSYIHMFVNRAFRSKQRFYELVTYDFLSKSYTSQLLRKTVISNSSTTHDMMPE